jgi:NTE family protein
MLKNLVITRGLDFQIIRGVSVGSLNAAFLAQAPTGDDDDASLAALQARVVELEGLWRDEIKGNHSVYKERFGGFAGLIGGADSLHSFGPLEARIDDHVTLDALRASGRDFAVGTVSLVSSLYEEWTPADDRFIQMLLASSAIPVVFPFQRVPAFGDHPEDVLVDGGVRDVSPLSSAFRADPPPDEIYLLLASKLERDPEQSDQVPVTATMAQDFEQWDDNWLGTKVDGMDVLKRTVDILTDEVYLDDIRNALKWNRICKLADDLAAAEPGDEGPMRQFQAALSTENRRYVPLHIIAPKDWYSHTNASTDFFPSLIGPAIDHGEWVAEDESRWFWPEHVAP